jgi:hypothetical protein
MGGGAVIDEKTVRLAAETLFKYTCPMCSFNTEEAESIEELAEALELGGWEDCTLGDSEGIFCPECIYNELEEA